MAGTTLIITGASRGIGAATARLAGKRGFAVAVNFVRDARSADSVVRDIVAAGGRACAIQADVGSESQMLRLFETAERSLRDNSGALVNNAAITGGEHAGSRRSRARSSTNFCGSTSARTILCSREAVRRMSMAHGGGGRCDREHLFDRHACWRQRRVGPLRGVERRCRQLHHRARARSGSGGDSRQRGITETGGNGSARGRGRPGPSRAHGFRHPDEAPRPNRREIAEAILWLLSPAASYVTRVNPRSRRRQAGELI